MSQTWDEHAPRHEAIRRHFGELDFEVDPRSRLLAKCRAALDVVKEQPGKCHGGPEYVRGLRDMIEWVIGVIESDIHNEEVDAALHTLTGKRLGDLP